MKYLFISASIFLLVFCSQPGEAGKDFIPQAPLMVEKLSGADTTLLEKGIDAIPQNDAIQLMWHSHPQAEEIEAFRIYKSVQIDPGNPDKQVNYNRIGSVPVDNIFEQDTTFVDNNAVVGQQSFYYITALSKDNLESIPSDTVWYTLLDKAQTLRMEITDQASPGIIFNFQVPQNAIPNQYIIRVEEASLDESFWELALIILTDENIFVQGGVSYTLSGANLKTIFKNGRTYQWRVDFIEGDPRYNGSESPWQIQDINWIN